MLYKQIEQNKRKTILLILLFSVLVLVIGALVGLILSDDYIVGLILAAIVLVFYVPITILSASSQVLNMSGAKQIQKEDHPALFSMVENLAMVARIPTPKIYIVNDPSPNAFATGLKPSKGAVAFTTGLLERLNREELEGVAAHEIAHIRNYDIRLLTICIALVGVVVLLGNIGLRAFFFRGGSSRGRNQKMHPAFLIIALVLVILAPIAAQFVQFAVSRNREYLADATAVEFTRNSVGLKNALLKISQNSEPVQNAKPATASMYISNPFKRDRKRKSNLFATHPPIEERIERLEKM